MVWRDIVTMRLSHLISNIDFISIIILEPYKPFNPRQTGVFGWFPPAYSNIEQVLVLALVLYLASAPAQ